VEPQAALPTLVIPTPPKSFPPLRVPPNNPITPAKAALGKQLFFDPRLSADGSRACYSCHLDEDGTGGHGPLQIGAKNVPLTRHAPIMWNVAYLPAFYWDGRADSLEAQMLGAWGGANMGVGKENLSAKADELGALPEYRAQFEAVFPGEGATPTTISQAVATYERTLFCADTAFDKFSAGDSSALTDEQKKGWDVFTGKGGCQNCHTPPFFSDAFLAEKGAYHNVGIGTLGKKPEEVDIGRQKISSSESDYAAFKTPSLRDVARSAPYFHDGSVATLAEAVTLMAKGGIKNKNLDSKLSDRKLTPAEISSVVAFLGSLTCPGRLQSEK
jgi:cytochrome c peroxidase